MCLDVDTCIWAAEQRRQTTACSLVICCHCKEKAQMPVCVGWVRANVAGADVACDCLSRGLEQLLQDPGPTSCLQHNWSGCSRALRVARPRPLDIEGIGDKHRRPVQISIVTITEIGALYRPMCITIRETLTRNLPQVFQNRIA